MLNFINSLFLNLSEWQIQPFQFDLLTLNSIKVDGYLIVETNKMLTVSDDTLLIASV